MALLLTLATGAWAQDPDPIDLTPSADGTVWTLSTMPEYDVELEVTYYTDEEVAEMEEAAFTAGVDLTKNTDGSWTLDATPGFDIELEVEYETDLALSEEDNNTAKLTEWNGYEADITLTRTLQTGGYNTFALPFSFSIDDFSQLKTFLKTLLGSDIAFKELTSSSFSNGELTLNFTDATEIKAGQPYLVKVPGSVNFATLPATIDEKIATYHLPITNPFKGVIISKDIVPTETAAVDFIPTLGATSIEGDDTKAVLFFGASNSLKYPTSLPANMKGFRAYFQLKEAAAEANTFSLVFDDGDIATGIISVEAKGKDIVDDAIYDLQGRKVTGPLQKGVYIKNGKKINIK